MTVQKRVACSGYASGSCKQNHQEQSKYPFVLFPASSTSKLIIIISISHLDPRPFVRQLSLYFQIRDDYQNLVSDQVGDIQISRCHKLQRLRTVRQAHPQPVHARIYTQIY